MEEDVPLTMHGTLYDLDCKCQSVHLLDQRINWLALTLAIDGSVGASYDDDMGARLLA